MSNKQFVVAVILWNFGQAYSCKSPYLDALLVWNVHQKWSDLISVDDPRKYVHELKERW